MPYCFRQQKESLWSLDAGESKNIPSLPSTASIFEHKLFFFTSAGITNMVLKLKAIN